MDTGALFDAFINANTFRNIQHSFLQLCTSLDIDPCDSVNVYKQLRCLQDWKAAKLWKLLDKQMEKVEYRKQKAADRLSVLVIGAGPCGLRSAIECALLGSRVVVIEQRDRFSRNNVLHLWEFVIHDIKSLGAKIFYPKFCTGSIEHISIRQLQCILLKVSLCLGVQVHEGVSFTELIFPKDQLDGTVSGFRAALTPEGHILSNYEFDVLIGADGKRNTVPGFQRDEMRGKLAIAITANFVNNRTAAEERVPEISGVAYIFNQAFFKEMYATTGVDLENIVYYKDGTHYFVMCAKKHSLLDMGVIKTDFDDATRLLASDNVDREALCNYARAAADFATHGKLPALDFAKNHRSQEDIAMFDFTSLYSSKCSVRLVERRDKRLLMGIVGDSLHEPFWPTGSGCARGFLGVFDTAWLIREYGLNQRGPLEMIADRESVYKLLAQVTKDNMHKSLQKYTIDPRTRYVSPDFNTVPIDVVNLVNSDNPRTLPISDPIPLNSTESAHTRDHKQRLSYALWRFCNQVLAAYKLKLYDLDICWRDGKALAALLAKFLSDKVDYFKLLAMEDATDRLREVFSVIEAELGVQPPCAPEEWEKLSKRGKQAFIGDIVVCIRNDLDRLRRSVITPKSNMQKRKIQPIQASRRKTQPIEKLAQDLLGCSTFRNGEPAPSKIAKNDFEDSERHAKRLERLSNEGDENANKATAPYRYKTTTEQKEEDAKTYTKRPQVDRLDPTLVGKVEKIVTGDLVKDREKVMYAEKDREAARRAGKMDRSSLQAMERKLMEAGMAQSQHKTENMTSQEEKIMRAVATDARREAESGFTKSIETDRFKQYDETIKKSEESLKKRDIAGIDPFNRRKEQPTPQPPPPVPPKPLENQENSVIFRPTAPVLPKRHSVPVLDSSSSSCYDSVNARKQTNCQLCNKVVYLAERMQVESIYIHKNCFRCAYCNQPLRLGEYGKDKDLEFHHPTKFFCNIHLRVPLRDKIARIERANRLGRGNSKETAAVPPLPVTKPPPEVVVERRSTLSFFSPEQLRESTIDRMQRSIVSPVAELTHFSEVHTPERAEFGSHTKVKEAIPVDEKKAAIRVPSGSESEEEDEEAQAQSPDSSEKTEEEEDSLSDSESLEEDEIAELETTVLQLADENPDQPITEEQVLSVIDKLNKRRANASFAPDDLPRTPEKQNSTEEMEEFFTPAVTFRTPERAPPGRERARTIAALPTEDELAEFKTPCMDDIRKQKSEELARLRNESRARAASKTDAELGIGEKRFSVQLDVPSTPVTSRAHTDSPPRDRTKPRSSSLLNDMPSMRRDSAGKVRLEITTEELRRSPRPGMLSKLFSPDLMRKKAPSPTSAMVNADRVHCDSRKETSILGNAFRRLKLNKHRSDTSPKESPVVSRTEPRVAAVAPSPRIVTDSLDSPSTSQIPVNERSLKSFAKKAEKIIRQRDEALPRTAQEIQRSIQQNEIRLEEIRQIGEQHEKKLTMDPLNKWELECWMALVREKEALQDAIEASKRRLRKLELQVRYRDLNARFRQHDADEMPDQNLLTEMLTIVQEKDRLEKDGDMKFKKGLNIEEILGCKKYDYRNFDPVFSSERL